MPSPRRDASFARWKRPKSWHDVPKVPTPRLLKLTVLQSLLRTGAENEGAWGYSSASISPRSVLSLGSCRASRSRHGPASPRARKLSRTKASIAFATASGLLESVLDKNPRRRSNAARYRATDCGTQRIGPLPSPSKPSKAPQVGFGRTHKGEESHREGAGVAALD